MMKYSKPFAWLPLVAASLTLAGCVDDSYDLDDIDLTLGSEVDLALPNSSTGDILLRNFLDLKDDGIVQEVWDPTVGDTIFCVKQSGNADIDPIHIDRITMDRPDVKPFDAYLDLLDTRATGLPNETFHYIINKGDVEYTINETKTTAVSHDVVSIESVRLADVTATLRITFNTPAFMRRFYIDGLDIELPHGLEATRCVYQGQPIAASAIDNEAGIIHVTPAQDATPIDIEKGMTLSVTLSRATVGEGGIYFDAQEHSVRLRGAFTATGRVRLESDDFDLNRLAAEEAAIWNQTHNFAALMPRQINIEGRASFDKDIAVTHFTGDVRHAVNSLEPIRLDNMPDFLNDPDVLLDLENPIVYLRAYNEMSADATTQLTLTANGIKRQTEAMTFKGRQWTTIALADHKPAFTPAGYEGAIWNHVADLGGLIRHIPDEVTLDVTPVELHCTDLDITKPFQLDLTYDIFAPLTAGPDFQLVYRDSEKGWIDGGDLDDIDKVNAEQLIVTAKAKSDLPATVQLTLIPIDRYGKRVNQLEVNSVTIKPCEETPVELGLKAAAGYTINDVLTGHNGAQKIDGLTYEARITDATPGQSFHTKANVKLTEVKIRVKGKVSYDAN